MEKANTYYKQGTKFKSPKETGEFKSVKWNAFTKGNLGGKALDKIGTYQEGYGGGTPLPAGGKAPSEEWLAAHRKKQPRDEDGKFTYNAANAKPLKYGPSRGKTVPPFLRGVELTFAEKGQVLKTKDNQKYKYSITTINMSVEQMIKNCKEYVAEEGGFLGMGKGSTINKKGRPSKVEKLSGVGKVNEKLFDFSKSGISTQQDLMKAIHEYSKNKDYKKKKPKFASKGKAKSSNFKSQGASGTTGKENAASAANSAPQPEKTTPQPNPTEQPVEQPAPAAEQKTESQVASDLLKTDVTEKQDDVEFNSAEIGESKEEVTSWVKNNKNIIKQIQAKNPNASIGGIVNAIKKGKVKKLSDFLGG